MANSFGMDGSVKRVVCVRQATPKKSIKHIETSRGRMLKINLDLRLSVFKAKKIPCGIIASHIE